MYTNDQEILCCMYCKTCLKLDTILMRACTPMIKKFCAVCIVKPVLSGLSKIDKTKVLKTDYHLMHVKGIAECSKRAFCNTFDLHLPSVLKTFVLSTFEWPLKIDFTVYFRLFMK